MASAPGDFGLSLRARSSGEMGSHSSAARMARGTVNMKSAATSAKPRMNWRIRVMGPLISFRGLGALKDDLCAFIGFHRAKKLPYSRIGVLRERDSAENKMPLYFPRVVRRSRGQVVLRGAHINLFDVRDRFDFVARRHMELQIICFFIRKGKIDSVNPLFGPKYPGIHGGKKISREKKSPSLRSSERRKLERSFHMQRFGCIVPMLDTRQLE